LRRPCASKTSLKQFVLIITANYINIAKIAVCPISGPIGQNCFT